MYTLRSRQRAAAGFTALAVSVLGLQVAAGPVSAAAAINDPPVAPHSIIVFPVRDFVSADGYAASDRPTIQVLRGGAVIGTASNLVPQNGLVEVNHPGGGCWEGVTPDIRPGDVVRVLTAPDTGDQTGTANVTVTQPATKIDAGTVVIKGTAAAGGGGQIPLDQLEARIVANKQSFVSTGKRTLRASSTPGDNGVLAYDGPGLTTWTATFKGLDQVSRVDGLSDADRAVSSLNAESRGMWLGQFPGSTAEGTIFEYGQIGGPSAPCTAPLAKGPSIPDMTAATDTGTSSTDNITRNATPTFTGAAGLATSTNVNLYVDGAVNGTAAVAADGGYSLTPASPLADGQHIITASEFAAGVPETRSAGSMTITVTTAALPAPVVTGTDPATGSTVKPAVKGTASPGSIVSLFTDSQCTAAAATGTAADFAATGIPMSVPAGSSTAFFATATDVAGNTSPCSTASPAYLQDSVAPPAPGIAASSTSGLVNSTSATIAFTDAEAAAKFTCSLDDGAPEPCTSPANLTAPGQGTHSYAVRAVDAAGNASTPATASWTVDTVAPAVGISSPVGKVINDTSPTFRFSASESGSAVVCSVDGAPATPCTTTGTQTSSALADGPHTFTATATDPAGNTGAAASYAFTVDTVAPVVGIDTAAPSPTNSNTPGYTFSSPEPGVGLSCAFAPATNASPTFSPCASGSFRTGAIADGDYKFTVKATDAAGNAGAASSLVTVDTVAPAAPALTNQPPATTGRPTVSFGFSAAEPGVSYLCTLTPQSPTGPCTSGETYGPLLDGSYTFKVQAKDQAGNLGTPTTATFTVAKDTIAPTVTGRTPAINALATSQTGSVTATFSEKVAGLDGTTFALKNPAGTAVTGVVSYDAATNTATLKPATALAADTKYTASLSTGITDATAGNPLAATTWTFTTGPAPVISSSNAPSGATGVSQTANLTATLSEAVTGVTGTSFTLKDAAGAAVAAAVSYSTTTRVATLNPTPTLTADRKYTLSLTSGIKDAAGNPLAPATWTFLTGPRPTVRVFTPGVNTTRVSRTNNITAELTENVTGVSGTTFALKNATTGAPIPAVVTYSSASRKATLNPNATLPANTRFTATMSSSVKDVAGNPLSGTSWSFTTGP
jgi:hypothetical protein